MFKSLSFTYIVIEMAYLLEPLYACMQKNIWLTHKTVLVSQLLETVVG